MAHIKTALERFQAWMQAKGIPEKSSILHVHRITEFEEHERKELRKRISSLEVENSEQEKHIADLTAKGQAIIKSEMGKTDLIIQLRAELESAQPMRKFSKEDIEYPRDLFSQLICGNSDYAFYLFQWVPYQTEAKLRRLKMRHDVKTFDGRIELGVWPNGSSCGSFKDSEVEFIRISKDQGYHEWKDPMQSEGEPPC